MNSGCHDVNKLILYFRWKIWSGSRIDLRKSYMSFTTGSKLEISFNKSSKFPVLKSDWNDSVWPRKASGRILPSSIRWQSSARACHVVLLTSFTIVSGQKRTLDASMFWKYLELSFIISILNASVTNAFPDSSLNLKRPMSCSSIALDMRFSIFSAFFQYFF